MIADEQLVKEILEGNVELFRELVTRYQHRVLSVAYNVTLNQKDAEDIAQEVFLQIYRSLSSFQFEAAFSTWVYRVTMNKALDWKRKRKGIQIELVDRQDDFSTERFVLKKLEEEKLKQMIDQLPEIYHDVLHLYYFEQRSYQQIAKELSIELKTVESRLYRARSLLREQYRKEETG